MPRSVYLALAWLFAGISVALAARYGFKTADTPTDSIIYAIMFGTIAAGGGAMQALAVHVATSADMARGWRSLWGVIIGAIGLAAMFATVLSSLGAIAGRADATAAERTSIADNIKEDRATLARLTGERAALAFTPADADALSTAKAAVAAAERTRAAECGNGDPKQRGSNCRLRETEEANKRDALALVATNKALTDRAAKLDADIGQVRKRLETAPPVQATNPLASALGRMLGMSVADAADRRDLFLAVVLELLVAGSMIGVELTRVGREPVPIKAPDAPDKAAEPQQSRPGGVHDFMAARVVKGGAGDRADHAAIFLAYKAWCLQQSPPCVPLAPAPFGGQFAAECKRLGIALRRDGRAVYCEETKLIA